MIQRFRSASFDAIDLILIAAGFGASIAAGAALFDNAKHVPKWLVVGGLLGGPLLRRTIAGDPQLPPPRRGPLWSLLSIVAALLVFFGMGAALLAVAGKPSAGLIAAAIAMILVGAGLTHLRYPRGQGR